MALEPYNQGVPSVSPQGPSGNDYQRIDPIPGAFGAPQAQALAKTGAELTQASGNLAQTAQALQDRHNQISVDNGYNQLQDIFYKKQYGDPDVPGDAGIYGLRGRAALDKGPETAKSLQAARQQIYDGLQNDHQKLQFDVSSRRLLSFTLGEVGRHIDREQHVWGTEVSKAQIDNAARDAGAAWNNDEAFGQSVDQALKGAARLAANSGNANDPDITRHLRQTALDQSIISRADRWSVTDPKGALNWLQNGKMPNDGSTVMNNLSGPAATVLQERLLREIKVKEADAQKREDLQYTRDLIRGSTGGAPARPGTPFIPKNLPQGVSLDEDAMVRTVSGESKGQPLAGQRGVAAVILNRAKQSGTSPREVVFAPKQFEPWNGGKARVDMEAMDPASPEYQSILNNVVRPVASGAAADPTGGATHFYAPVAQAAATDGRAPVPNWAQGQTPSAVIGGHNFYNLPYGGRGATAAPSSPPEGGQSPAQAEFPDESAIVQRIERDFPNDPIRQQKIIADVRSQIGQLKLATQTERDDLTHSLPDIEAAARGGQDVVIPEARIRRLLPPAMAAREIENLGIAQQAGQVFKSVKWGSPEDVQQAYQDLSSGLGPISKSIRSRAAAAAIGAGGEPSTPTPDQESPEAYRLRTSILHQFEQQVATRRAALNDDPAGYVATNPIVAAKAQAIDPSNPASVQDYYRTVLSVQSSLGVPSYAQAIMSKDAALTQVGQLTHADPATTDTGAALAKMAQGFGPMWPRAFGDMVRLGKLPANFQTLAQIPNATTRWDFQQMLRLADEKGGLPKLRAAAGDDNAKQIEQGIDSDQGLINFKRSAMVPGIYANLDGVAAMRDGIKNLATYYTIQGMAPKDALSKASGGILDGKYDFEGTMRVPKGQMAVVQNAARQLLDGLKPDDLAPMARDTQATEAGPGLSQAQRRDITLTAARKGNWVANENDSGLYLVGQDTEGRMHLMRRQDGSRIELKFGDMAKATPGITTLSQPTFPMIAP